MLLLPDDESDHRALRRAALLDTDPDPAFDRLVRLAVKLLDVPIAMISLIDDERQWFKARSGLELGQIPRRRSICEHTIITGDLLVIGDTRQDPRSRDSLLVAGEPHVRFYAGVPLRTGEGAIVGTLCVLDHGPRSGLSPEQTDLLQDLGVLAAALIEAQHAVDSPRSMSRLPGRSRFLGTVNTVIGNPPRADPRIAIVVIDIATPDQYEELRRVLGEDEADLFHDASVRWISECLPVHAGLYRLSVTRFGCVLPANTPDDFEETFDRLAYRIRAPERAGHSIPVATSIGIGVAYYPHHGADAAELFRAAISGVHESLEEGKPWCTYSPAFDRKSCRAARLLRDIGPALTGNQFHLVYQPKIDISTGRCIGAEALLRWNHPTLGPISPDEFVPLIERTTLVHAMTDWTLGTALHQIALWRAAGLDPQISINVSMRDLWDDHFVARLAGLLERHAVRPDWIDIEVTEGVVMKDPLNVGRRLGEIRRLGIAIEIDDYGTGQAGLSYLKYIPASYVKIPQVFVFRLASDREDQIIVRSTIDLVHDLGLRVVAEGIRDKAALTWLREHGCDIGQGNVLSPPLEAPHFERWLRDTRYDPPYSARPKIVTPAKLGVNDQGE